MKKIISLSTYLFFSVLCIAQNTESVTFKVEDFNTNKIVVGAQISIKEAGWATKSTGADGKVLFEKMPMGEIHYTVLKDGYQRLDGAVNVTTRGDDNNFLLSLNKIPKPNEDKILITGEVTDVDDRDVEGALVEAKIANIIRTVQSDESGNYSLELELNGKPGGTKIFMEIKTKSGCKKKDAFDLPREVVVVKDFKLECGESSQGETKPNEKTKPTENLGSQIIDNTELIITHFEQVGSKATFHFTLENKSAAKSVREFHVHNNFSAMNDQDGNAYDCKNISLGNGQKNINLIYGNTVKCIVEFNVGAVTVTKAAYLKIGSYHSGNFEFTNIRVK